MGLFGPSPPKDPTERLFEAVSELNEAWAAMPSRRLRPWIDWQLRQVLVTEYRQPEGLSLDEAKGYENGE